MKRWLFLLTLGVLGALFFRAFVAEGIVVASGSMEPTLPVGGHYFLNKSTFRWRSPRRGDIVVFPSPVAQVDLIKRVVALETEEVKLVNKQVIVNGQPLWEPYAQHTRPLEKLDGDDESYGRVPAGHVFVLGDNRDESGDSRDWKDPQTGAPIHFVAVKDLRGTLVRF